ncbi:MAG TPA: primosomal protein N' [Candidatus Parabacteroides intestinavium]|nr:primosomal protein N' [Candidatus Parabacteroides intestinavium]
MHFADVILPLPLADQYTYKIPSDLEKSVVRGCRVIVHFGKKRFYTAIVSEVYDTPPKTNSEIKEIFAVLDATPILRRPQLRFWQWMANYYLCRLGDVYKAALPSGLKIESETSVTRNPDFETDVPLKPNEQAVLYAFAKEKEKLTLSDLEKKTGLRNIVPIVASLMAKGAVEVNEELKRGYVPKTETYVRLASEYKQEEKMQEAFDSVRRAKKQEQLLVCFLDLSHALNPVLEQEISKKELLEKSGQSASVLEGLLKRGVLETYEKEVSRLQMRVCRLQEPNPLSDAQKEALWKIQDTFREKNICLLHGVTSSGKTEIYIHLIRQVLNAGRQVLYMLPEIAITTQITERLGKLFGEQLLVYHSKFSDNERVEVWNRLLHAHSPMLILGVRSSLFLPFSDLGLIIVDEEHETSYKQQDPSPRYNARNAAMVLAGMHGGKTLLGSATPSIDSYFNALSGKYGLVELKTRFGTHQSPKVIPVNIKELKRKKQMKHPIFSPPLIQSMRQALDNGEQVILFQNRRGFAPITECKECGWVPRCVNCDVSMTYHKYHNNLVCHYCGYTIRLPEICPSCGSSNFQMQGFGTEKVEEEIALLFPDVNVERMDMDTTRTRTAYERIIGDFDKGKTQILIGTQMISKGLDFGNVGVVGILNADGLMNYPDFRAHERAFQLMLQVSGRTGRRDKQGTVILQTSQPEHPLIQMVIRSAYREMVDWQLSERSIFHYPPYFRLIVLVLRSKNEAVLQDLSRCYAEKLRSQLGNRVLGPVTPPVSYIQTWYIRKIVIKIETAAAIQPMRGFLESVYTEMQHFPTFRQMMLHYDVDPL